MPRRHPYDRTCTCPDCNKEYFRRQNRGGNRSQSGGTFNSTAFRDVPQRNDPSVTNTYFNSGEVDGGNHGHVKHRDNPDGTTDYLFVRDVEGNEYDT